MNKKILKTTHTTDRDSVILGSSTDDVERGASGCRVRVPAMSRDGLMEPARSPQAGRVALPAVGLPVYADSGGKAEEASEAEFSFVV